MQNATTSRMEPVPTWFITGERTRIKNTTITCPTCHGKRHVTSMRGTVAIHGDRRGVLIDPSYTCPHCGKRYETPVEVE